MLSKKKKNNNKKAAQIFTHIHNNRNSSSNGIPPEKKALNHSRKFLSRNGIFLSLKCALNDMKGRERERADRNEKGG